MRLSGFPPGWLRYARNTPQLGPAPKCHAVFAKIKPVRGRAIAAAFQSPRRVPQLDPIDAGTLNHRRGTVGQAH
jgi:hypothetical protein